MDILKYLCCLRNIRLKRLRSMSLKVKYYPVGVKYPRVQPHIAKQMEYYNDGAQ